MLWRIFLSVISSCPFLAVPAAAQTYYRSSPGASDAERIATDMLNDAASGRFRQQSFGLPDNPFARMIEEYEAERRAKWADFEQASEQRRHWEEGRVAYEADLERREAEYAAAMAVVDRLNAYSAQADEGNSRALLQMAWMVQGREHEGHDIRFGDLTEAGYVNIAYSRAALLGSDLGFVGYVSLEANDAPNLGQLRTELRFARSPDKQREFLWSRAQDGHLAAMLWLGAWYAGRDVELGAPPAPLPECADSHASALRVLRMAMDRDFGRGASWYARELLVDATPAERVEAFEILRRAANWSEDYDCRLDALTILGAEGLDISRCADQRNEGLASLTQAAELNWTPARLILGDAYLAGRGGRYLPASAAKVYEQLPQSDLWWDAQGRARLHMAIGAEFNAEGLRATDEPWVAYAEAWNVYDRATDRHAPQTDDARECLAWLTWSYVRHGRKSERFPDPVATLRGMNAGGRRLPRLLWCFATLDDERTSRAEAQGAWAALADLDLFIRPLAPEEILLVLGCVESLLERGAFPELKRDLRRVANQPAQLAPVAGGAQLARLYFTPLQPHDTSDRAGLPRLYSRLIAGAWQHDSELWWEAAALAEVMQIDPITPEQWRESWLLQFLESQPCSGEEQAALARALAKPTEHSIAEAEMLLQHSKTLANRPAVLALLASLKLRSDSSDEVLRAAFKQLIELAEDGSWHAQALIEDFEPRYRAAYLERLDPAGFQASCARSAELVAGWRESGHGFMRPDPALRARAIGTALLHGSTRHSRADLDALASAAPAEVERQIALLDALAAEGETIVRRVDREITTYYLRRHFEFSGIPIECDTPSEQIYTVGQDLSEKFGPARAVDFLERQIPDVPEIAWQLGTGLLNGGWWIPQDPQHGLEVLRRAAHDGRVPPDPSEVVRYMEGLGEHGTRADVDIIKGLLSRPEYAVDVLHRASFPAGGGLAAYAAMCDRLARESEGADRELLASDALRFWIDALRYGSREALMHVESEWANASSDQCALVGRALLASSALNSPLAVPWLQRACAGGDAAACTELATWIDPATGQPSKRHAWSTNRNEAISNHHREMHGGADVERGALLEYDYPGKGSEELTVLLDAARGGDEVARELLVELSLAEAGLVQMDPVQWIAYMSAALARGDLDGLPQAGRELPAIWDEIERTKLLDTDEDRCLPLGRVARRIGIELRQLATAPDGVSLEDLQSRANTAIQIAIQCGDVAAFRAELAHRQQQGEAQVLALCAQVLDQDPCNAPAIEMYALPLLADRSPLLQQFQKAGLYTANSAEPNPLMVFTRTVSAELCAKYAVKYAAPTEAVLFPRLSFAEFGFLGRALWRKGKYEGDAEARRLLLELGFGPERWDKIFKY